MLWTHGWYCVPVGDDHCASRCFDDRRAAAAASLPPHVSPGKDNRRIPPGDDVEYSGYKDSGGYTIPGD